MWILQLTLFISIIKLVSLIVIIFLLHRSGDKCRAYLVWSYVSLVISYITVTLLIAVYWSANRSLENINTIPKVEIEIVANLLITI